MTTSAEAVGASAAAPVELPPGWRTLRTSGPGPFVSHAVLERPDGRHVEWSTRRHRKGLGLAMVGSRVHVRRLSGASPTSWWMGALFGGGSVCFAVGSVPLFFETFSLSVVAGTFFAGSLLFTAAAYLQLHEVLRAPTVVDAHRVSHLRALVGWRPRAIDWWASVVQLVGTVCFNVSTFAATRTDLTTDEARRLVWAPDVYGSICFLIASGLAYAELNPGLRPRPDHSVGWRIVAVNMLGSIAFGASAIAARLLPTTGDAANIRVVNLGTFVGAVCFLIGAGLLPVESARDRSVGEAAPVPSN